MMKVLILSCATGEGHNSAAKAYLEHLVSCGIECEMRDTLELVSREVSHITSDIYLFSTRTSLFRFAYRTGSLVSDTVKSKTSPVYLANKLYCKKLYDYITTNHFDTVVCVHLFPAEAITALKRNGDFNVKTIFVMTDYTCIPFMKETQLDYYIVPHYHLIEECVSKGLPREKLFPFGIPVKKIFHRNTPKAEARVRCQELFASSADPSLKWFLIMSGSMGFGPVQETINEALRRCGASVELFLVCGNNEKLRKKLASQYASDSNVRVIGFTDQVPLLMDACDVLFTKPGGLSSTEAASKGIPIIHTAPIPGCETRNAEFFHYHGMSYSTGDIAQQITMALRLVEDAPFREKMIQSQKSNTNPDTCRDIMAL